MKKLRRSSRQVLLALPALAGAAAPAAPGAVIYTNLGSGLALPGGPTDQIFFNIQNGTAQLTNFPSYQFNIYFDATTGGPQPFGLNGVGGVAGYTGPYSTTLAKRFLGGQTIDNTVGPFISDYTLMFEFGPSTGQWHAGDSGFLGLKVGSNYGWANVTWNNANLFTLYEFAYEDTGAPIIAGAVGSSGPLGPPIPEPAESAALMALAAGSAAAWAARRKRKMVKVA